MTHKAPVRENGGDVTSVGWSRRVPLDGGRSQYRTSHSHPHDANLNDHGASVP
jgi:hypothetical protein